MSHFLQVVQIALRRPIWIVGITVTALIVGVLWGGNISAIYPVVEVAFRGESLHYWIDLKIQECEQEISRIEQELAIPDASAVPATQESHDQYDRSGGPMRLSSGNAGLSRQLSQLTAKREWYLRLKPWILRLTPNDAFSTLVFILVLLLIGTFLKSLALVINYVLVARVAHQTVFELRRRFFAHVLRLELDKPGDEGVAHLMSRFTHDINCIYGGLSILLGKMVREPLKMVACLIGAAWVCFPLLIFSLLVVPPAAWAVWELGKMLKRANRRAMEEMAQLYGTLEEALRSLRVVKAYTMEPFERRRFYETSRRYLNKGMRIAIYDALIHPLTEILGMTIISLAMAAGAYLVLNEQTHLLGLRTSTHPLTMPELVLFYALLAGAADPVRKLSDVFAGLQAAMAASDRVFITLKREPEIIDRPTARRVPRHRRHLFFDHVAFAYTPDRPVLRDINLEIPFGETLVIVGGSGSGKSTLLSLIPRFFDPDQGEIRLDGVPLPDIRLRSLRSQIGLVPQEPVLFNDTILNNIKYGSPHATDEQAIEAAQAAHAHGFIEKLPHGYDTLLGPMGCGLSGGQRQRIALARAILRNPAILILDEATSQIDVESEQLIHQALERFTEGRTTIIVTHRLNTIALADRVLLLDDGRILGLGPHSELLEQSDLYRRLYFGSVRELHAA
ncbi:MAG: ABC transporter ATP-binding protein [Thermogutta sp.]